MDSFIRERPVGSGKTALLLSLCQSLRSRFNLGVVTNDIFTRVCDDERDSKHTLTRL